MKVKDVRLRAVLCDHIDSVKIIDSTEEIMFLVSWGGSRVLIKTQAIAIAKRLCDRFNAGQEKK